MPPADVKLALHTPAPRTPAEARAPHPAAVPVTVALQLLDGRDAMGASTLDDTAACARVLLVEFELRVRGLAVGTREAALVHGVCAAGELVLDAAVRAYARARLLSVRGAEFVASYQDGGDGCTGAPSVGWLVVLQLTMAQFIEAWRVSELGVSTTAPVDNARSTPVSIAFARVVADGRGALLYDVCGDAHAVPWSIEAATARWLPVLARHGARADTLSQTTLTAMASSC